MNHWSASDYTATSARAGPERTATDFTLSEITGLTCSNELPSQKGLLTGRSIRTIQTDASLD